MEVQTKFGFGSSNKIQKNFPVSTKFMKIA